MDKFIEEFDVISIVKKRILSSVTVMSEKETETEKVWHLIQGISVLTNAEEAELDAEELASLQAYESGEEED